MLTIKTNKNNCKLTYVQLNISSIVTGETVDDDITIAVDGGHNLKENDEVAFIRQDGETIYYFKDAEVKTVLNKNEFTVDGFGKYTVGVNGYKPSFIKYAANIVAGEPNATLNTNNEINQKNTILHLRDNVVVEITGSTLNSGISQNYGLTLISVEIGTDVTKIDNSTFRDCSLLTSVTIPNTVTSIGNYVFYDCFNLDSISIPNSVTSIGDYAFYGCTKLKKIFIGNGITYIGKHVFNLIYGNTIYGASIYISANEPPKLGDSNVFMPRGQRRKSPTIHVPVSVLNDYKGVYMAPIFLQSAGTATSNYYVCLNTNEHIFTTNKDDVNVRRRYIWDSNTREFKYDGALTMCNGDYYTFDDLFLVKNINNTTAYIKNTILNITASTVGYETIVLRDCLIGVNFDGNDDKYHIYIPYNENLEFTSELEERLPITTFTADDIRFLYDGEDQMFVGNNLQPGAYIDKVCGNIEVDFNIGDNFEVNLHHSEQIANYVEKIKNRSVNNIIDYERYPYTPMYYDGGIPTTEGSVDDYLNNHCDEIDKKLKEVTEIKFRLNFRTKDITLYDEDGNITETDNDVDYVDFGTWQTDDNGYWDNYKLRSDNKALEEVYKGYNVRGDLLGYLGFTDDDIYFQKDAFKKSFLRLSFYDSPNRERQKLLYYSTIYFDTNVYSSKYIKDLNAWRENPEYNPKYNQLVFAYDIGKFKNTSLLTAEISCTDKYDNTSSSDGFYLHLFDKLVSGNTCTPIYMKAEFNNAKYGKTVPMIRPIFGNTNIPIDPTSISFPREYMKAKKNTSGDTYVWTDMNMLLQDMYIKIFVKYNYNTHQFVWFIPQGNLDKTLTFDLFEPRVKGYDFASYETMQGNDVGYNTLDGAPSWFQGEFNGDHVWITEDGKTESEWAADYNGCCLMTTATTLPGENMVDGTKLFNKSAMKNIAYIWIDGMMARNENVYDEDRGQYKTTKFQLPDIPFPAHTETEEFLWNKIVTTKERWSDSRELWYEDVNIKPKKIHKVNYYFKTNTEDQVKLIDELYTGIRGDKKTKEITQDLCSQLKNSIQQTPSETLPRGMFSEVDSLRCIRVVGNGDKYFTTIGNGAFNNCQNLIRVTIDNDGVYIIGKNCFSGCRSLKEVNLSNTKIILREAFQGCYTLTKVIFDTNLNNSTKYIGCGAFGYTKIRGIRLPNSILRIGNSAFRRCYQLNEFNIEGTNNNLTVGKRVFADCAILKFNLTRDLDGQTDSRYTYWGGVPSIIRYLANNGNRIEFYDACRNKYLSLLASTTQDRGNTMYHYKNGEYHTYLHRTQTKVMNFEDWYRYIF